MIDCVLVPEDHSIGFYWSKNNHKPRRLWHPRIKKETHDVYIHVFTTFFAAWRKKTMNGKHPKKHRIYCMLQCVHSIIHIQPHEQQHRNSLNVKNPVKSKKGSKFNMSNEHRDIKIGGISVVVDAGPQIGW